MSVVTPAGLRSPGAVVSRLAGLNTSGSIGWGEMAPGSRLAASMVAGVGISSGSMTTGLEATGSTPVLLLELLTPVMGSVLLA